VFIAFGRKRISTLESKKVFLLPMTHISISRASQIIKLKTVVKGLARDLKCL
jgi:hypothetical protein